MLKEYRICMPISVEEYHIGQLYMIARHSSEQSDGGEGVEVIQNNPHTDLSHGQGQFTEKRIHLSGKLPAWIRSYVPRFIYLTEKAWNYYPYTETEYTCSVIPRFSVKIRTCYQNDSGTSENCLSVVEEELRQRVVDHVDILTDPVDDKHYRKDEDLSLFKSEKTGRGPLCDGWREGAEIIMCSYKLVDVSFQVFGIQTRVEDFVHRAIRNVLLLGHRQAFAWIDEWYGMTLEDVRQYETGMQETTNAKIRSAQQDASSEGSDTSPNKGTSKEEEEEEEEEEEDKKEVDQDRDKNPPKKQGSLSSQSSSEGGKGPLPSPLKSGYLSSWFKWS